MSDTDTDIESHVGESFEVVLYSQPGSTGYGWHLAGLPEGVVLVGVGGTPVPPVQPGSQIRQVFTFTATHVLQGSLLFELLRLWDPTHPADTRKLTLTVSPAPRLQSDLEKTAGRRRFALGQAFRSHLSPAPPYGFPDATKQKGAFKNSRGLPVWPLYAFPVPMEAGGYAAGPYGAPHHVVESSIQCTVKYGFPWGVSADPDLCVLKYGFPVGCGEHEGVHPMYGFPPTEAVTVHEDADNCVIKYGVPGGIAMDPAQCTLKYGFPRP